MIAGRDHLKDFWEAKFGDWCFCSISCNGFITTLQAAVVKNKWQLQAAKLLTALDDKQTRWAKGGEKTTYMGTKSNRGPAGARTKILRISMELGSPTEREAVMLAGLRLALHSMLQVANGEDFHIRN